MPYSFLNGEKGAHVSISGKSGVATKTSYALFLLYMMFETHWGLRARGGSSHDRAVVFSVKGSDLCLLDRANNRFVDTDEVGRAGQGAVDAARRPRPAAVPARRRVRARRGRRAGHDAGAGHRRARQGRHPRLRLDAAHDDRARPAGVRVRRPRVGPAVVHRAGRARPARALDVAARRRHGGARRAHRSRPPAGVDRHDVGVRAALAAHASRRSPAPTARWSRRSTTSSRSSPSKVSESDPAFDPTWVGGVSAATGQAFVRRLWKATPRLRRLVRAGLTDIDLAAQLSVVDVHALHADAQRFVVASVLAQVWAQHENSTAAGQDVRRARRAQQVRPAPGRLADQEPARRRRRPWPQPRRHPRRRPAEPVRRRPRHHEQRLAGGRRPDQGVGVVRARLPAAGHAGAGPDHRPRHDDHVAAAAAGAGADPVPVPAVRDPRRRGARAARRRRRRRAACWRTCDRRQSRPVAAPPRGCCTRATGTSA